MVYHNSNIVISNKNYSSNFLSVYVCLFFVCGVVWCGVVLVVVGCGRERGEEKRGRVEVEVGWVGLGWD
jgi:hypothetical protein